MAVISKNQWTSIGKDKYKLLLKECKSKIAKAIEFYLINEEFKQKSDFVLKILKKYAKVDEEYSLHDSEYGYTIHLQKIPEEIKEKLIQSYRKDLALLQQKQEDKETEALIAEMNEIF